MIQILDMSRNIPFGTCALPTPLAEFLATPIPFFSLYNTDQEFPTLILCTYCFLFLEHSKTPLKPLPESICPVLGTEAKKLEVMLLLYLLTLVVFPIRI